MLCLRLIVYWDEFATKLGIVNNFLYGTDNDQLKVDNFTTECFIHCVNDAVKLGSYSIGNDKKKQ